FFSTGRGYFSNPSAPGRIVNVSAGFVSFVVGTGGLPSRPAPGNASYVGGGAGSTSPDSIPRTTTASTTPTDLNIQPTNLINPINQTYTITPPPVITSVPSILVGSVPVVQGSFGNSAIGMSVSVNDVKFYGPAITAQPQMWTAGSVTGNFWHLDGVPDPIVIKLTGGGLSAYAQIIGSDEDYNGTWNAAISNGVAPAGVGQYTQPFTFSGTAAGTWSANWLSTGTLTGTASGVVPGVLTQEPLVTQAVQVGAISSLSSTGVPPYYDSISLNQIKFWGPGASSQPYAWTATVSGSRALASTVTSYNLTNYLIPGASATLTPASIGGGVWTAYINGAVPAGGLGSPPNFQLPVGFHGKAGGTYTPNARSKLITGTAGGKAYPAY
ncbi:MAG: hypothetical protein ACYDHW_09415, partial [Syntrophorhabdaceae bacterium]